jgi:hypothetical protein
MRTSKGSGILEVKTQLNNGGHICVVNLSKLEFGPYQRGVIELHTVNIAAKWDDRAANLLKISLRDGLLYCYDGRQTSTAAKLNGLETLEAIVFEGMTMEDEAKYFFIQNDVPKKMNGWNKFHASIMGGNKVLESIVKIVHKHKLTIPQDPGVEKVRHADVTSTRGLLEAYSMGGLPLVGRICKVMNEAWRDNLDGNVYLDAKKTDMWRGLYRFLRDPDFDFLNDRTILTVLAAHTPAKIRKIANRMPSTGRIDACQITSALQYIFKPGTKRMVRPTAKAA